SAGPAVDASATRSMPFGIVSTWPGRGLRWRATVGSRATSVAMMQSAARAAPYGPAEWRISHALHKGLRRSRGAELLESLRIEDERHRRRTDRGTQQA